MRTAHFFRRGSPAGERNKSPSIYGAYFPTHNIVHSALGGAGVGQRVGIKSSLPGLTLSQCKERSSVVKMRSVFPLSHCPDVDMCRCIDAFVGYACFIHYQDLDRTTFLFRFTSILNNNSALVAELFHRMLQGSRALAKHDKMTLTPLLLRLC